MRGEVKDLVRKKKLVVWNEVVEKVNVDFDESAGPAEAKGMW